MRTSLRHINHKAIGERSGGGTLMIIWFEELSQLSATCPPPKHQKPAP